MKKKKKIQTCFLGSKVSVPCANTYFDSWTMSIFSKKSQSYGRFALRSTTFGKIILLRYIQNKKYLFWKKWIFLKMILSVLIHISKQFKRHKTS